MKRISAAENFILELMSEGENDASVIKRRARAKGLHERTIQRAAVKLGLAKKRLKGGHNKVLWRM